MSRQKIIILGGGTSGWLSAAYLVRNLINKADITLIEDIDEGPIGVGEGTQPYTTRFLFECGLLPEDWMKDSDASFKLGVELVGWTDNPYFVDNDSALNNIARSGLSSADYFLNKKPTEFTNWQVAYQLAKANKSPKISPHGDFNFNLPDGNYGAIHFSASSIINTIKNKILSKISYIKDKIINVTTDDNGIKSLISKNATYSADLYIDCTGFKSLLLNKSLNVVFNSYDKWLPCDRAVAIQTEYKNPVEECKPYTTATTMKAGWRWTIPTFSRLGNGYVYSSKFITDEEAEAELRYSINNYTSKAKFLTMKCGRHEIIALKNVCAVGLSAGFVEPLEATGITFTTSIIRDLVDSINFNHGPAYINSRFDFLVNEVLAFVWSHYYFSSRDDTEFWKHIRKSKLRDLPNEVIFIIRHYYPIPTKKVVLNNVSMFNLFHWFSVLHAGGAYKDTKVELSDDDKKYLEYFIKSQTNKVSLIKDTFPNNYEYLSSWYS